MLPYYLDTCGHTFLLLELSTTASFKNLKGTFKRIQRGKIQEKMAPKKRPGKMVKTVVTAKKVVEETVKVVVTPTEKDKGKVEVFSSTKESENVSVSVQDKEEPPPKQPAEERDQDETQPASEPETTPQPPKLETSQEEKKRKSPQVKEQGKKKKKKGRAAGEGYKRYIFRVMKQVHPDMGFSSMAMTVINNLMSDMFERIANEAAGLLKFSGRTTLSSREIQGAVKLVLPGELGKHAIAEGTKAVTNYISSISKH